MEGFDGLFLEEIPREINLDKVHLELGTKCDVSVVSVSNF
jgi:hypothetical protein